MKKILVFTPLCLLLSCFSFLYAAEKVKTLGGPAGWTSLSQKDGLTTGKGRFGYQCLQLAAHAASEGSQTDLLLAFDDTAFQDQTGHYQIVDNSLLLTKRAVMGAGAGLSRGGTRGISLKGSEDSVFGRSGLVGSFTIQFWLAPAVADDGEVVFSWRSSRNTGNYPLYQMITASFSSHRLMWNFTNIFDGYSDSDVSLGGSSTVIPDTWALHSLSYDETSGRLEYTIDGKVESVRYVTSTNHENGSVCSPVLGVRAAIEICPQYTGRIDDFKIERSADAAASTDLYATGQERYKVEGGRMVTEPIRISESAVLNSISAIMNVPEQTAIRLYVRSGDSCYDWDDSYPAWKEVLPGETIKGISGLYFQVAADLLPDGGGTTTPSLTELDIRYTEQPLPLPPFIVRAVPGDGSVTVSWSYSVDDSAGGYYVYYGNRSGEYLGRVAAEGPSPVNAGNTTSLTLTGLKNGTIYYFAVSAWSRTDNRINGTLSKEVFARPTARAGSAGAQ
jgi:hypothetical protein